jgi:hypothetical protein
VEARVHHDQGVPRILDALFGETGEAFFIPVPYKGYSEKDGAVLPDVDVEALKKEFGETVRIMDAQIKAAQVKKESES